MKNAISIDKLVVNPENYRFDFVENQDQAISLMLEEKGSEILNLATHIAENGLDESKDFRVLEIKKNLFSILDGNRRATAIKCLSNPSIIKNGSLKEKFVNIKKEAKNIPEEINCFVYETEEEAAKWIKLDHTGKNKGVGLDSWGTAEQEKFSYRFEGKMSPTMKVIHLFEHETKSKIDTNKVKVSTIERILTNPESREYVGLDFIGGEVVLTSSKKEVVERLNKLFDKIIIEDVPVQDVYDTDKKVKFMKDLFGTKPKPSKETTTVSTSGVAKKTKAKVKKSLPRSSSRDVLIPGDCVLVIYEKKINNIYHELREISLKKGANAVGVLFRVFLETGIDCYADNYRILFKKRATLADKIKIVAKDLEKKGYKKNQLTGIRSVTSKGNSILSINKFHEYVHSFKSQPAPVDLITKWENLQEFFEILWEEIAKKKKKK